MILSLIAAMASNRIIGNQGDIPLGECDAFMYINFAYVS
jgi:hypothetical protein